MHEGKIYLNPKNLTPETIAEEFIHLQQNAIRLAAENGDKQAQKIVDAWDNVTSTIADKLSDGDENIVELLNELGISKEEIESDVYQQQKGESDLDYRERIQDELWAKSQKVEFAKHLERLAGEGKFKSIVNKMIDTLKDFYKYILNGSKYNNLDNLTLPQLIEATNKELSSDKFLRKIKKGTVNKGNNDIRFLYVPDSANFTKSELDDLETAKNLVLSGVPMNEVQKATNWVYDSVDGWQFEIDDSVMELKTSIRGLIKEMQDSYNAAKASGQNDIAEFYKEHGYLKLLNDLISHSELFNKVPKSKEVIVAFIKDKNKSQGAAMSNEVITINLYDSKGKIRRTDEITETILHEIQHIIQDTYGLSQGGNPRVYRRVLGEIIDKTSEEFIQTFGGDKTELAAAVLYLNLLGEKKARDAGARASLTAEQRRQLPAFESQKEEHQRLLKMFQKEGLIDSDGNSLTPLEIANKFGIDFSLGGDKNSEGEIKSLKDIAQEDASKKGKSSPNNTISISLTPFAGNRIPRYRDMYERITSLLEAGNTKDAQDIINNMREDVLYRLQQLLPDASITTKDINGFWEGSDELSFSIKIDNVTNDTYAAIAKVAQDFDQDAVHILESVEVKDTDVISVKNSDGSAIIPVVNFKFEKEMSKAEFAKLLKSSGFLGASLDADGMGATIYYSDTHNTKEEAEIGLNNFHNKINKFINDSKGTQGTIAEDTHAKFTPFNRGGNSVVQGTYEWANSKIHTSDAYKERLRNTERYSEWARRSLSETIRDAVIKVSTIVPKIGNYIKLNTASPDYKRLSKIGDMFDRMPLKDMSKPVIEAYRILTKVLDQQYNGLPVRVYPNNRPIVSAENIAKVRELVDELNEAISSKDTNRINEVQAQIDKLVSWSENRYDDSYPSSQAMISDVEKNNQMEFFTTGNGFGSSDVDYTGHPLLDNSNHYTTPTAAVTTDANGNEVTLLDENGQEILIPKRLVYNDVLRVVHDYIAHAASGASFGPKGEERAWAAHWAD